MKNLKPNITISNRIAELSKQLAEVHIGDNDCLGKIAIEIFDYLKDIEIIETEKEFDC